MQKRIIGAVMLMLVILRWGNYGWGEQRPAPRGELRVVDRDLSNFGAITFTIFEHLLELDQDGQLVPRLATGWQWLDDHTLDVMLRQDVTFHNGEVFNADIVKLNVEETQQLSHAFYLAATLDDAYACQLIGRATNIVCEGEMRQIHSGGNLALG